MIKYRPTTFLPLLLSYLLLGVIPSQGANVDDKLYEYYWFKSPTKLKYTGKGNFNDAIKALNREFILMEGYIRQLSPNSINNDILGIIFNNIRPFPPHFDLTEARDLSVFNDIRPMITEKFEILSLSFPKNNTISLGKLTDLHIDLSGRRTDTNIEDIKKDINALILWKELNEKKNFRKTIKLPPLLIATYSNDLKKKGWIIISEAKGLEIIELIEFLNINYTVNKETIAMEKIEQLIKEGADVNAKRAHGFRALSHATYIKSVKIAKLLIENGADVNEKNKNSYSPLFWATYRRNLMHAAFREVHKELIHLLVAHGADVNAKINNGCNLLDILKMEFYLTNTGRPEMITFLIDNGAKNSFFLKCYLFFLIFHLFFIAVEVFSHSKPRRERRALEKKNNRRMRAVKEKLILIFK